MTYMEINIRIEKLIDTVKSISKKKEKKQLEKVI